MEQRLEKKDLWFIGVCLLITALCLGVGVHYFYRAFPEASIDFKITRDQARDQALSFLRAQGLDLGAYRHSAVFRFDDQAKTFLERELGLEGATALIGRPVRLWRWSNRWTRELEKEEFRVDFTTTGELVGFAHLIEEDQEGAHLAEGEARLLAEEFLVQVLGRDLGELEFVEAEATQRPHRMDHSFTWKLRAFQVSEATYRLRVLIQGDRPGGFDEFLKVPETWQRQFAQLQSRNQATGLVAFFFLFLTLLAMLAVFFGAVRRQDVRWKTALIFGAIAFALTLLAQLNLLPLTQYGYDTTDTYGSFLTRQLLNSLLAALAQGVFIFFLTAAAEPLYRRHFGQQIRLSAQFLSAGLRTRRFLLGTVLGLTMTAFFFAYQTLFYLVAERFGAWSPAQIPYDDMVNTHIPWVMVLLIGFMPAVSEEFMSRAFSIPFLHRYLRSPAAAVVVSALIWGFAHATYPQQPFFIRGLEVGLAGILIGFIFLRWGLLAPLVWHYTVDALYTALILLRSSNPYFVVSAALSAGLVLLPLVAALALYLRHRSFADPIPLLNQADAPPLPERRASPAPPPVPPSRLLPGHLLLPGRRLLLVGVLVLASLGLFAIEIERPLDYVNYAVTRTQAQERATAHLRGLGVEVDGYQVVAYQQHQRDAAAIKYLLERVDAAWVNQLHRDHLLPSLWLVRFFRFQEKEEYQVAVHPQDGSIYAVRHLLPEEAPGADLGEEEARALALDYLRAQGLDPDQLELKEASSEKLPSRCDHRFVWEAREGDSRNLDELRYRCRVEIAGDQPVALVRYLKLPETWLREREESTALKTGLKYLLIALGVAVSLHLLWLLVRQVRQEGLDWGPAFRIAALVAAFFLLNYLNELSVLERAYDTRLSLIVFALIQLLSALFGALGVGLLALAGLGLATALYPDWKERLRQGLCRPVLADGLMAAVLVLVAGKSLDHLRGLLQTRFAAHDPSPAPVLVSGLDAYLPFWNGLATSLGAALVLPVVAGLGLYYARSVFKKPLYAVLAVLGFGLALSGSQAVTLGEFCLALGLFLLTALFAWLAVVLLLRYNLYAYLLLGFLSSAFSYADKLLDQSAVLYQVHAGVLSLSTFLLIIYLWRRAGKASSLPLRNSQPPSAV
jgi:membrane protease YdiL (CAAX protease family)